MAIPQGRDLRWSLDFVVDTLVNGRRFRILTLVDDFTRECLGLVVDPSLTGLRVPANSIASPNCVARGTALVMSLRSNTDYETRPTIHWR